MTKGNPMTDTDREETLLEWWDRKTKGKTDPIVSEVRTLILRQVTIDRQEAEISRLNKRVAELEKISLGFVEFDDNGMFNQCDCGSLSELVDNARAALNTKDG